MPPAQRASSERRDKLGWRASAVLRRLVLFVTAAPQGLVPTRPVSHIEIAIDQVFVVAVGAGGQWVQSDRIHWLVAAVHADNFKQEFCRVQGIREYERLSAISTEPERRLNSLIIMGFLPALAKALGASGQRRLGR